MPGKGAQINSFMHIECAAFIMAWLRWLVTTLNDDTAAETPTRAEMAWFTGTL
jgi:hypothetical protein